MQLEVSRKPLRCRELGVLWEGVHVMWTFFSIGVDE